MYLFKTLQGIRFKVVVVIVLSKPTRGVMFYSLHRLRSRSRIWMVRYLRLSGGRKKVERVPKTLSGNKEDIYECALSIFRPTPESINNGLNGIVGLMSSKMHQKPSRSRG